MTKLSLPFTALALAILSTGAHAACGGGGWSKSAAHATPLPSAEVVTLSNDFSENAQVMSVRAGPMTQMPRFDTTQFDTLSLSMHFTDSQSAKVKDAKSQVQKRIDALKMAYQNAQTALVKCDGHCDAEGRTLESATVALKEFDANLAFVERLSHILNSDQFAHLESVDHLEKRQGI
jgi:hypothetical protein